MTAPKSGTTSLYDILKQHPNIFLSSFKEPHFFDLDENWNRGVSWYESNYFSKVRNEQAVGEFTPTYLCSEKVAQRIRNSISGKIKFVIVLRNPTDRAYSHYLHTKRDEFEKHTFTDALSLEKERMLEFESQNDELGIIKFGYCQQSIYSPQLKSYFNYFDRSNFYITTFDRFADDNKQVVNEILDFLELPTDVNMIFDIQSNKVSEARSPALKRIIKKKSIFKKIAKFLVPSFAFRQKIRNVIHSANNKTIEKEELSNEIKKECYTKYFEKDILELEEILSINLTHWKIL